MRLIKIVYEYSIQSDAIHARHFYDDGTSAVQKHDREEWRDLLADIEQNQPEVQLVPAMHELLR